MRLSNTARYSPSFDVFVDFPFVDLWAVVMLQNVVRNEMGLYYLLVKNMRMPLVSLCAESNPEINNWISFSIEE
jgi:hypothetical protein